MIRKCLLLTITFAMLGLPSVCRAQTQEPSLDSAIEVMRANMGADRATIIAAAMNFSDKDATAFWPIYRNYEHERSTLDDRRVDVIKEYADKPQPDRCRCQSDGRANVRLRRSLGRAEESVLQEVQQSASGIYSHEVLSIGASHRPADGYESGVCPAASPWTAA